jgi:hypothetical protein
MKWMSTSAVFALALLAGNAAAAVSAEEAAALGKTLTPVGAIKAGNVDGSIPAYSGPITQYPADYKPNSGRWTNPYRDEKPLYTITAQSVDKYADKLTDGERELFRRYPDFRMEVYPSHRDAGFPQYWLDKSVKNATTAKLDGPTADKNDIVEGAWGGVPFPIPKSGSEAMWNYKLRYYPYIELRNSNTYLMDSAGHTTTIASITTFYNSPYGAPDSKPGPWALQYPNFSSAPPRIAGQIQLIYEPLDYANSDLTYWAYTPGQRRVRLAPEAKYDTPAAVYGGVIVYDEISMFTGRLDRFDWKLAGRKEILIPYHTYDMDFNTAPDKVMGPHFPNPEVMRWELHRVWVVESTLKKDKRHIYSKRNFYLDEDSWNIVASDAWDLGGKLYRVAFQNSAPMYGSTPYPWASTATYFDLNKGAWAHTTNSGGSSSAGYFIHDKFPPDVPLQPDALAGYGIR